MSIFGTSRNQEAVGRLQIVYTSDAVTHQDKKEAHVNESRQQYTVSIRRAPKCRSAHSSIRQVAHRKQVAQSNSTQQVGH